jgi:CHAD domain-containing protein
MARARPILGVTPDMPFGAFASRVIAVRADEARAVLMRHVPDPQPELVHDRRVAIRRLRTALEVFQPALPRKAAKEARRELKQLFGGFGDRRDADVAIAMLLAMEPRLAGGDRPGWRGLLAELDAAGGTPPDAGGLPFDPADLAGAARSTNGGAAADAMQKIAGKRLAAVRGQLAAVGETGDADALHELRIAAKRLRYVLEVATPVIGDASKRGVLAARSVQDVLGELHDCDVLLPRIRAHRRALRDADVAAVRAATRPPNTMRYRGVQTVETRVRARREDLHHELAAHRPRWDAALEKLGSALAGSQA